MSLGGFTATTLLVGGGVVGLVVGGGVTATVLLGGGGLGGVVGLVGATVLFVGGGVTATVLFLLSRSSGYVTGQVLPVNGGFVMN